MAKDIELENEKQEESATEKAAEEDTAAQDEQEAPAAEETENTAEDEPDEKARLEDELAQSKDKYLRLMAEYDNFRKRSAKERLELTDTVKGNTLKEILPVFDNFERALAAETQDTAYKQGVEMIFKQFGDMLAKLGVEIIDPLGETFDANVANAVSQIDDPELGENEVAKVFQKGYKIGDKVIRYAMVVVANP
ncbi:MAG: nucleotide exchange factor GrpE [Ruminococcus sp.]|nr:nucleotide exchange factor GrpE [Ruminococcus sp.]